MAVARTFDPGSEEYRLGQNIRKYRELRKMSQTALADAIDIDRAAISHYENGVRGEMGFRLLNRIAHALQVTTDELLGNDREEVPYFAMLDPENKGMVLKMAEALYTQQTVQNM